MKNVHKILALTILLTALTFGTSSVSAGIIINDRNTGTNQPCSTSKEKADWGIIINDIVGIIINDFTGIIINDSMEPTTVNCGIIIND